MVRSHPRKILFLATSTFLLVLLPWLKGQEATEPVPPKEPATTNTAKNRDPAKMSLSQRHFYLSAQRGADWLQRANKPDGRFVYGFLPAVKLPMEEEHFLGQVEAAFALGRAAKFFGEEKWGAIARQALLSLLLDTAVDPKNPQIRYTATASSLLNRPAAAGHLLLAIHELPAPGQDLLDQGDQLCNFLLQQFRADGSIAFTDNPDEKKTEETEALLHYSGPVLHGVIRSQQLRPAPWKLEALRRSRAFYQAYWEKNKNVPMVPGHTAAYAEAYALTRDKTYAESVFAMNDWLCTLQYQNPDPRRSQWRGGFQPWIDGKAAMTAPDIRSAIAAESLADACRVAKLSGDVARQKRYQECLESCLQFLTTLQYTSGNTLHFSEWYRPFLVGGFHASTQDGNLRLDYTEHAVAGLVQYLDHVADLP